jgi:DNA-directed RNA polymerase specialized sigma24 family protein
MDGESERPQTDALLLPYLRAADDAESNRLLGELLSEHAQPVAIGVIRSALRVAASDCGFTTQDVEDINGEAILKVLRRLRHYRNSDDVVGLSNFRSYVAVTAYNVCCEHLRRLYPERHRLKNRLRHLLTHQNGFACWQDVSGNRVCGFAVWQQLSGHPSTSGRLRELLADVQAFERNRLQGHSVQKVSLPDLLAAIFDWTSSPVVVDELVHVVGNLLGIRDQKANLKPDSSDGKPSATELIPEPRVSEVTRLEQRRYLEDLWAEILRLPLGQRTALLLSLKDSKGRDLVSLLAYICIASIPEIATALSMSLEKFTEIWNSLPAEDETIARHLGVTRQQVVNLRVSARRRLARRMDAGSKSVQKESGAGTR